MIKITFHIGLEKDKDSREISTADQILLSERFCKRVARVFGGYTALVGAGGWADPSGKVVEESVLVVSTVTDKAFNREESKLLAEWAKSPQMFNQSCIMVTRDVVSMEYV